MAALALAAMALPGLATAQVAGDRNEAAVVLDGVVREVFQSARQNQVDYLVAIEATGVVQVVEEGHDLLATIQAQDVDEDTFVWAAGEATTLVPVRRHLKALGLPKANLSLHGYWKRGEAGLDHHAPLDPADPD